MGLWDWMRSLFVETLDDINAVFQAVPSNRFEAMTLEELEAQTGIAIASHCLWELEQQGKIQVAQRNSDGQKVYWR